MKNTGKIALCGVMSALSMAIMLLSYLPITEYAVPAMAGIVFIILVIETDYKWAFLSFAAASVLVILFAAQEAKIMFLAFFGYYPILKGIIEKLKKIALEIVIKVLIFNVAVVSAYSLLVIVLKIPIDDMGILGKYGILVLWVFGNLTFLIYDFALTQIVTIYLKTLHPKLKKLIK